MATRPSPSPGCSFAGDTITVAVKSGAIPGLTAVQRSGASFAGCVAVGIIRRYWVAWCWGNGCRVVAGNTGNGWWRVHRSFIWRWGDGCRAVAGNGWWRDWVRDRWRVMWDHTRGARRGQRRFRARRLVCGAGGVIHCDAGAHHGE
jgi:hypothetical protein